MRWEELVTQRYFADHATAIDWAQDGTESPGDAGAEDAAGVQRVEFRGLEGDRRWAGAIGG